jgi:uncharacterized membrane protein YciS (DUF1049 family)
MQWMRTAFVLVLVAGLVWVGWSFRSGNAGLIDLDLVWVRLHNVALWSVVGSALAAGWLFGLALAGFGWLRQRLLNRRYRKTIERLESEVHQLRSLPLSGSLRAESLEPPARAWLGRR